MKRLTIITILLLVLIGCHSDDETPTPATPADTLALSTPEPADLTPLARPSANSDEYWLFWRIVLDVNETPCDQVELPIKKGPCHLPDTQPYEVRKEVSVWRNSVEGTQWVREFYGEARLNCGSRGTVKWSGDHLVFGAGGYISCMDVALVRDGEDPTPVPLDPDEDDTYPDRIVVPNHEYRKIFKDCSWSTSGSDPESCLNSESILVEANISLSGPICGPTGTDSSCELGLFSYNQSARSADPVLVMKAIIEDETGTRSLGVSTSGRPDDINTVTTSYLLEADDWHWLGFRTMQSLSSEPYIKFNVDGVTLGWQPVASANEFGFTVERTELRFGDINGNLPMDTTLLIRDLIVDPQDSCVSCFR